MSFKRTMTLIVNNVGNIFLMGKGRTRNFSHSFFIIIILLATSLGTWEFSSPHQGSNPCPLQLEAHSLNHCTTRKSQNKKFKKKTLK